MGYLIEEKFPDYGVQYIAINDSVDTDKGVDESLAIRDLFNEWHARDTSKKIKAVKMAAAKRGERIGSKPPYGYKKDPDDPKRIVPNEDTAPIVRRVFSCVPVDLAPARLLGFCGRNRSLRPQHTPIVQREQITFFSTRISPMGGVRKRSAGFWSMKNTSEQP